MTQSSTDTCQICQKPKTPDGSGSLTQWINCCQCNLSSAPESELLIVCRACGKRMREGKSGSVTQWIFAEHLCKCEHPQPVKVRTSGVTFKSKAFEEDDDDPNEKALDLDDDLFPTNRYKPLKLLGHGALGQVYLCRDLHLRKKVALKSLFALTDERIVSFQQEAKTASRLSHEKVIKVFDFGTSASGRPYMVMEYFPGRSLQEVISERGFLEEDDTCIIFQEVCEALSHLHEHGIFHRDLKPSNILLLETETGEFDLRLIDFGLSKIAHEAQSRTEVQGRTVVGTPGYMSPDQASGLEYDERSEIYSLGCIMYEALAGQPPFSGETPLEVLNKHMHAKVPPLQDLAPDVNAELCAIIEKCLNKKPEHRYRNTNEVADAIADVVANFETAESLERASGAKLELELDAGDEHTREPISASKVMVGVSVAVGLSSILILGLLIHSILSEKPQANSTRVRATFEQSLSLVPKKDLEKKQRAILKQRMKSSNAKKLDLRHACVDEDLLVLSAKKSVMEIDVSDSNVSDRGIEYLADVPHLQSLNLTRTNVKSLSGISKLKRLRYLYLDNTLVDDDSLKKLKGTQLKLLSLGETRISDAGLTVLEALQSLQILDLMRNDVGKNVVRVSSKLPNLRTLDVRDTSCTLEDVVAIAKANLRLDAILVTASEQDLQMLRAEFPTIKFKAADLPLVETWGLNAEKEIIKTDYEAALKLYQKSLAAHRARHNDRSDIFRIETGISYCLSKLNRLDEAEKLQQKLVSEYRTIGDKGGELGALKMYSSTLLQRNKFDLAEKLQPHLFELSEKLGGVNSKDHRETQLAWASASFAAGRYDKSIHLARVLRAKFQSEYVKNDPVIGALLVLEGVSLEASHKSGFLPLYKEGLDILHAHDEKNLSSVERYERQLGELFLMRYSVKSGDWKKVEELSHIFLQSHEHHASLIETRIEVYKMRSQALEKLGRTAEAKTANELLEKLKTKAAREKGSSTI